MVGLVQKAAPTQPLFAAPHNLRYVKCLLRFKVAASRKKIT
jgi:hypothetical protein